MKHRTMQGREVDMEKLMTKHELMPAVGNIRVNARGDELGPGGIIIRSRADVVADYYEDNPNAQATPTVTPAASVESPVVEQTRQKKSGAE